MIPLNNKINFYYSILTLHATIDSDNPFNIIGERSERVNI
uniref:Uncharacterized protein n=1 Tax=viral metagenome TaxID=1070528 RepID=A0A6C0CCJ0_9ZZZZ